MERDFGENKFCFINWLIQRRIYNLRLQNLSLLPRNSQLLDHSIRILYCANLPLTLQALITQFKISTTELFANKDQNIGSMRPMFKKIRDIFQVFFLILIYQILLEVILDVTKCLSQKHQRKARRDNGNEGFMRIPRKLHLSHQLC